MSKKLKFNFSGYATKNDLKCSDGRVIKQDAFKHQDGAMVPLVWQHGHDTPENILGHAYLENRKDGVYAYAVFNETAQGKNAKALVEHKDVTQLSIYANKLVQKGTDVLHGDIKEVSIVLAGANPGALIDNIVIQHADGSKIEDATEAVIYTGLTASTEEVEYELSHAEGDKTMEQIFDSLDEEQKNVVYAMIAHAVGEAGGEMKQSDDDDENIQHSEEGGDEMKKNLFDKNGKVEKTATLTHDDVRGILAHADQCGSLKEAMNDFVIKHAQTYGIENIDVLFPDAKSVMNSPEFDKRRTEWVSDVLSGIHKTPFSRIKSMYADITAEEARAKGYIKGNEKFEEVFPLFKRETHPTTIYKKQKLDRDDIIDVTDLDIVAWLKAEMRLMLDEERARAYLIGDGRSVASQDKIDEAKIRPIYTDDDKYAIKVPIAADKTGLDELEAIVRAMKNYKGSGRPTLYTTADKVIDWKLLKTASDENYRFRTVQEIADFIGVKKIVEVEVMEGINRDIEGTIHDLVGIIVNLRDYTSGADKGGKIGMFDDFDIDFNQYKYLMETRCSGALTKIYSALVIEKAQAAG